MKKRRQQQHSQRMTFFLPILSLITLIATNKIQSAQATIILTDSGKQYRSKQEHAFGNILSYGVEYLARLQMFQHDAYLCKESYSDTSTGSSSLEDQDYYDYNFDDDSNGGKHDLVVPTDGTPVAVLVPRGKCSIQQKARVASSLLPKDVVHYLIIFGNESLEESWFQSSGNDDLDDNASSSMSQLSSSLPSSTSKLYTSRHLEKTRTSSTSSLGTRNSLDDYNEGQYGWYNPFHHGDKDDIDSVNVTILYVTIQDGFDMMTRLRRQPQFSHDEGGLKVLLDGYEGWIPDYDDDMTPLDILSLISLCLILCIALSCITTNNVTSMTGGVVIVEGLRRGANGEELLPGRYRHGLRLLNPEEVLSLPEVEFGLESALQLGEDVNGDNNNGDSDSDDDGGAKQTSDPPLLCSEVENSEDDGGHATGRLTISEHASAIVVKTELDSSTAAPFHDIACTICLEDYVEGEKLRMLPCQHTFHSECIVPWLTDRSPTCPLCKTLLEAVREEDHRSEEGEDDEDMVSSVNGVASEHDEETINGDNFTPVTSSWRSWFMSWREGGVEGEGDNNQDLNEQNQSLHQNESTESQSEDDVEMLASPVAQLEIPTSESRQRSISLTSFRRLFSHTRDSRSDADSDANNSDDRNRVSHTLDESDHPLDGMRQPLLACEEREGDMNVDGQIC